jgi:hypothetical protein
MTKKFIQNLFIVEGSTDKNFMKQFINLFIAKEKLNISDNFFVVEIIKEGGSKSHFFFNGVENIKKHIEKNSDEENLPKTFLIVDADWEIHNQENQPAGYSKVSLALEKLKQEIKKDAFIRSHYAFNKFEIDYFIMPFNKETHQYGELETLFINALKPEYKIKLECINLLEDCLKQKTPSLNLESYHKDKMRMEILLKSFNKTMDKAIEWIDYESDNLQDLKDFYKKIFKLELTKNKLCL